MTNGLGFATASDPVKVVTTADNQVLVYRPFGKYETSAKNLIKVYFRLLVNCVKDDMKAVAMGMIAMGAVLIAGTLAVKIFRAHRRKDESSSRSKES
ncbi:hypothetical protein MVEG_12298 [Podila verticillata NRRL 6337]|uniref:Uncharacterized protein n=1 Tax=Podila verticillata NRRL 6337 TaxID=1069443 RepID=A0A086TIU2_9FUNG|nr:hypothetical protein MVEG_12298 [Podila verticillata NRRL 6337]